MRKRMSHLPVLVLCMNDFPPPHTYKTVNIFIYFINAMAFLMPYQVFLTLAQQIYYNFNNAFINLQQFYLNFCTTAKYFLFQRRDFVFSYFSHQSIDLFMFALMGVSGQLKDNAQTWREKNEIKVFTFIKIRPGNHRLVIYVLQMI